MALITDNLEEKVKLREFFVSIIVAGLIGVTSAGCNLLRPDFGIVVVNEHSSTISLEVDGSFIGSVSAHDSREFGVQPRYVTGYTDTYGGTRTAIITVVARDERGRIATIAGRYITAGRNGREEPFIFTSDMFR